MSKELRELAEAVKEKLSSSTKLKSVGDVSIFLNGGKKKLPPSIFVIQSFSFLASVNFSHSTLRLLFYFLSQSAFQNLIQVDQSTIREATGISDKSLKKALKELIKAGVILKLPNPTDKRRLDYFINPFAAWKGSSKKRKEQINNLLRKDTQIQLFGTEIMELNQKENKKL